MWLWPNGKYICVMMGFGSLGGLRLMCERCYYLFSCSTELYVNSVDLFILVVTFDTILNM